MAVSYHSPEPASPALSGVEHRIRTVNGIQMHVSDRLLRFLAAI